MHAAGLTTYWKSVSQPPGRTTTPPPTIAPRAHHIVPIDDCPILAPGLADALRAAWAIAETIRGTGKPLDIQVTATDSGLDADVRGSGALDAERLAALAKGAEGH